LRRIGTRSKNVIVITMNLDGFERVFAEISIPLPKTKKHSE